MCQYCGDIGIPFINLFVVGQQLLRGHRFARVQQLNRTPMGILSQLPGPNRVSWSPAGNGYSDAAGSCSVFDGICRE